MSFLLLQFHHFSCCAYTPYQFRVLFCALVLHELLHSTPPTNFGADVQCQHKTPQQETCFQYVHLYSSCATKAHFRLRSTWAAYFSIKSEHLNEIRWNSNDYEHQMVRSGKKYMHKWLIRWMAGSSQAPLVILISGRMKYIDLFDIYIHHIVRKLDFWIGIDQKKRESSHISGSKFNEVERLKHAKYPITVIRY